MADGIGKDADELSAEIKLLTYKFEIMENKLDDQLDKLSLKIDELIEKVSLTREKQAVDSQTLMQANDDIKVLYRKINTVEQDIVRVKVSMAEKLAFGGLGGALVVGLLKILELAMK